MDHSPNQWNEPATLGNLRDMAVRLDSRFSRIDNRIETLEARFKIPKNKGVGYDSRIMSESPVHFIVLGDFEAGFKSFYSGVYS